jgi:hypothetical protein
VKTDGNKEINQDAMAELSATNAPGIYYYDWVPTHGGTYLCYIDSLTDDYKRTMTYQLDIVARGSKYAQVMGVHGGMTQNRVTVRDTWTDDEKKKYLELMNKIVDEQEKLNITITEFGAEILNLKHKLDNAKTASINNQEVIQKTMNQLMNQSSQVKSDFKEIKKQNIEDTKGIIDKINIMKELSDQKLNKLAQFVIMQMPSEVLENV